LKSEDQFDMQSLHRARDRLSGERSALINQLRAILLERGITVPKGRYKLQQHLAAMSDPEDNIALSERIRRLERFHGDWKRGSLAAAKEFVGGRAEHGHDA
jgi:transposase